MAKPFLSFQGQINKLEQKSLIISDHAYAEAMLKQIGFFALISGYKDPFKNLTTKKYRDGTKFEDIVALYKLDENLRELFLKYILQFERHIRSLLSYYFTEKYGEQQSHYLNTGNFSNNPRHAADVSRLVGELNKLANQNSDYPYINHQRDTYGNVPLWVLVNAMTFGMLSKFYAYMESDLRAKVSKNFAKVNERQLNQYLSVITKFRNVCAHNERLFSFETRCDIPDTDLHAKLGIPKVGAQYKQGKHDLFAVVIAFKYLLPHNDFCEFIQSLSNILRHYYLESSSLPASTLFRYMGFPSNWHKVLNI